MKLKITTVSKDSNVPKIYLPEKATCGSVGFDLCAWTAKKLTIYHDEYEVIHTGIKIELPLGYEAQVRPRSGLAAHWGVTVLNAPGTIDSDYRGEIQVILINHGKVPFDIKNGDCIAQLVIIKVPVVDFEIVNELSNTKRGSGGFGHTGI